MFSLGNRRGGDTEDRTTYEPLLGEPNGDSLHEPVIFSVADDEDEVEEQSNGDAYIEGPGEDESHDQRRSVRFQEQVRVIGPPLRSTLQSREIGEHLKLKCLTSISDRCFRIPEYELDTDELDEHSLTQLENELSAGHDRTGSGDQSMPLLVGLMDSAAARRSIDLSDGDVGSEVDLEGLAAKRTAGGSMIDSVANMANSILGAGMHHSIKQKFGYVLTILIGIIGMLFPFFLGPLAFIPQTRSTLRGQSSRILYRRFPSCCPLRSNRLDNSPHHHQCEACRTKFVY